MKLTIALFAVAGTLALQAGAQIYDTNNEVVQTLVGSQFSGYYDGQGVLTMFNNPSKVVADSSGNLFVLDNGNHRIRKVTPGGAVSTFAGGGGGGLNGFGTNVNLASIVFSAMTIDHSNALWLTSGSVSFLLRIGADSAISQVFLTNQIYPPSSFSGLCVDSGNNIYISDFNGSRIYRYKTNGVMEVFAGSGDSGTIDGNGFFSSFAGPTALASDPADNIYVFQKPAGLIRRINQKLDVLTIAGNGSGNYDLDGVGTNAYFSSAVAAMCADNSGNIILACGSSIRMMTPTTNILTLAGNFSFGSYSNGVGSNARFDGASGVCFSQGIIFVADSSNQRIRNITFNPPSQIVSPANLKLNTYPGLQITGTVGRTYQIQTSSDMNAWATVTSLLLTASPYVWLDQNAVIGNKFYRAVLLP